MFQVVYEHQQPWPETGTLTVKAPPIEGEIAVSPDAARRRANGYLARYVALAIEASEPVLIWGDHPVWRMSVYLCLPGYGQVAKLGEIEVDALTRQVFSLSQATITEMQERADAIASRLTPAAEPAG
ncbi:MAG: hypothetical protein KJZ93_29765 [Caldilineaceae bacterium]|nr:hypothetical protein [Caldilineaceae bacterium]